MSKLSIITTSMGCLEHLIQTVPAFIQKNCECILVDYSCPDHCGDWAQANYPQVQVVRVTGEDKFSASKARNIGARAAKTPWLFFLDADILLSPDFSDEMLKRLEKGQFYTDEDYVKKRRHGLIICNRDDFDSIGGYDERYEGWGEEDKDIIEALTSMGLQRGSYNSNLVEHIPHEERSFYGKDRWLSFFTNRFYYSAKFDIMRLLNLKQLPEKQLDKLYQLATQMVEQASKSLEKVNVQIQVTDTTIGIKGTTPGVNTIGGRIGRSLTYSLEPLTASNQEPLDHPG